MQEQDARFILPSDGRGLVIGTTTRLREDGRWAIGKHIDPEQLRMALLFWDRLVWPGHHIPLHRDDEEDRALQYLEGEGVVVKPLYPAAQDMAPFGSRLDQKVNFVFSDLATDSLIQRVKALGGPLAEFVDRMDLPRPVSGVAIRQLLAFMEANSAHPGGWSLANDVTAWGQVSEENVTRGPLVALYRCIPVPDVDVPLSEILDFRLRRRDELIALRSEIERLYFALTGDTEMALRAAKERIDKACVDAIKVAKDVHLPFRLSDVKISFKVPIGGIVAGSIAGALLGKQFDMPGTGALLGGAMSTFSTGWDLLPNVVEPRSLPYRYVMNMHRDVFR